MNIFYKSRLWTLVWLGILVAGTAREHSMRLLCLLAGFVIVVGAVDEVIQWLLPNRVGDLRDVAMNTTAGVLGIWIGKSLLWDSSSSSGSAPAE